MNTNTITFGNPTCKYCGVTYPMMEHHNCVFSQEAKLTAEKERADKAEAELMKAKTTLRDQFAMAAMQGMLANTSWQLNEQDLVLCAYSYADVMLKVRDE
jgi:hypothetical protein